MTTPNTTVPNRDRAAGPGARLAQARNDLHLGLDEVAAKLHLSMRQIEALEQDDYQSLPGATYIRGYLKSYALLLGIDPGPVLDAHSQLTAKPSTAPDFSVIAPQREITSRHHQIRIVTYLVAVIVVGLAIAWWQGRTTPTPSPLSVAPDETSASLTVAQEPPIATEIAPLADPATPVAETRLSPLPVAALPPVAPVAVAPAPTHVAPVPIAANPPAAVPAGPANATPEIPETPATGPRGTLIVHAEQDTWVDVRDSRQVKLLYETLAAGRTVTLEGTAPISIFLGNAAGARIEYNGRAVDVARHKRGMFARFTVGEEQASAAPQN